MIKAYVLGNVTAQKELEILKKIREIRGIDNVEFVYGKYDFIAHVKANDERELSTILINKLRKIGDISSTQTLIAQKVE